METLVRIKRGRFEGEIGIVIKEEAPWVAVKINHFRANRSGEIFVVDEVEKLSRSATKRILKPKKKASEAPKLYVNVYRITREYGGPEEGGWYYNHYECIETREFPIWRGRAAKAAEERLEAYWKEQEEGDIYSVRGGCQYSVRLETRRAASETSERPVYC
jgi:hypothetical protein